jgi:Domain of unknown function (DUF4249)
MKNIAILGLLFLAITSCTKIINVDLNSTDPKVIIEADITDQTGGYQVKITKTVNFSDANNFPAVKGAVVTISDNTGATQTLTETITGLYTLKDAKGVSEKTYSLKVVAEGKTYTATSTMPKAVEFLGVNIQESPFQRPNSTTKEYTYFPSFFDPADAQNNYLFILSTKGIRDKGFENIFNDNIINGVRNQRPVRGSDDFKVNSKDTITVEMQCIDKGVYDYYYSLNQISSNNGNSATPANPVSNILGGALGYFSAHTVRKATAIIP